MQWHNAQTFFDVGSSLVNCNGLTEDVVAHGLLQALLQRLQPDETVDIVHMLGPRVRCYLHQLGLVCIFDSNGVDGDPITTQVFCLLFHLILRFSISDHHRHLLDALAFPASSLFDKDVLASKFERKACFGVSSMVVQNLDELEDLILVIEGVEVDLACRSVAVHDDANPYSGCVYVEAFHHLAQEREHQLKVGSTDTSRLVHNEHDISYSGRYAICEINEGLGLCLIISNNVLIPNKDGSNSIHNRILIT